MDHASGLRFPLNTLSDGVLGRLQAMNVVPVQDGGLALQWHLLSWPNSWFERFPLTLDQNLNSARGAQAEENSYWTSPGLGGKRFTSRTLTCPQTNPLTPSSAKIWDSAMLNPGEHYGEVWVSDSMAELSHPDLQGLVKVKQIGRNPLPSPDSHGTHVLGTMSALRNGDGAVGVIPGLRSTLFPLTVHSTQEGPRITGQDVANTLDSIKVSLLAQESRGTRLTRVILLSWAFFESDGIPPEFLESLEEKVRTILEHDVVVVVPSGNLETGRKQAAQRVYPASWSNRFQDLPGSLLPVGAMDFCSRPAWFSNLEPNDLGTVLLAPGERIYSTLTRNDYGFMSGSSLAAAQVAAVLSMTASQYPEVDMKTQVHTLLRTTMPLSYGTERLVSFDAPALIQGLMAEYGWIARH
ncbi:MAG: S8 family peptidase [Silvanigrellaceae bacterium]